MDVMTAVNEALVEFIQKTKASDAIYAGQRRKQADYDYAEKLRIEAEQAEERLLGIVRDLEDDLANEQERTARLLAMLIEGKALVAACGNKGLVERIDAELRRET